MNKVYITTDLLKPYELDRDPNIVLTAEEVKEIIEEFNEEWEN